MKRSASLVSRRRFLQATCAAALPLLAACGQPTSAPTPAPATAAPPSTAIPAATQPAARPEATQPAAGGTTAAVKRGGEMIQAWNWTVPTMDPVPTTLPHHPIYENVYDGLVRLDLADPGTGRHQVVGVLAESWEQPDAKTIVFKLRQGVKFHDGSDFDADVAKWNFERARDHEKSYIKASLASIVNVNALDKSTLEVKTKADNAALLRVLAFTKGGLVRMASKAAFDKNGEEWLQRNAVGTGPFKMKQWITDDRVILERNPDYFVNGADGRPLPYLDSLVMRYVPDPVVSLQDMRAGQVHFLQWIPPKDVASVKDDPQLGLTDLPWAGQNYFQVGFNTEAPPFDDVRVRQAALYAIDRVGMHKALGFGVGQPYSYPFWTPGTLGYDDSHEKYEFDPAKVKELLTQAGHPNGIDIELKVIAREPENTIGEFAQAMWSNVGIRTKLIAQERLSWIDAVRAKNFQSCFWRGSLDAAVDPELSRRLFACGGGGNWAQVCDKEVDQLMDTGLAELDEKKREAIYEEVWGMIQERAYGGAGYMVPITDAYQKSVKGVIYDFEVPNWSATWLG